MSELYDIPNNYIQVDYEYLPAFLRGFEHHHYVNLDNAINDSDFGNWVVGLYDVNGNEVQNFGAPTQDIISGSLFRFYFSFSIDQALAGTHFFAVYSTADNSVKYQSNFFKVIALEEVDKYAFIQFRNSSDLDNFNYTAFAEYNSFFLDLEQIDFDYEYEIQNYREQSTGRYRRQKNQKNKVIKLETYLFDEEALDGMFSLSDHDDVLINGDAVTTKTGFTPNVQRDMNVHKGTIDFYVTRYGTVNLKGDA